MGKIYGSLTRATWANVVSQNGETLKRESKTRKKPSATLLAISTNARRTCVYGKKKKYGKKITVIRVRDVLAERDEPKRFQRYESEIHFVWN